MNKIAFCFIAVLFFASCKENSKCDSGRYDIQFLYNPWMLVDFNSGIVYVKVAQYLDTRNISDKDRKL